MFPFMFTQQKKELKIAKELIELLQESITRLENAPPVERETILDDKSLWDYVTEEGFRKSFSDDEDVRLRYQTAGLIIRSMLTLEMDDTLIRDWITHVYNTPDANFVLELDDYDRATFSLWEHEGKSVLFYLNPEGVNPLGEFTLNGKVVSPEKFLEKFKTGYKLDQATTEPIKRDSLDDARVILEEYAID